MQKTNAEFLGLENYARIVFCFLAESENILHVLQNTKQKDFFQNLKKLFQNSRRNVE